MDLQFPQVPPGDDIRISASTYVTFKRCPESAHAKLQGIYGPDTRPAFLGSLAHAVFSRHLTTGPIDEADFVQACREEIGNSNLNHKLAALGLKPSELSAAIEEVRGLYERFVKLPTEGFEGSEVSLDAKPSDGVELVGKVDAVYVEGADRHRLVDWKTGEVGEPEDQLLFYALLWALVEGDLPAVVEAVSVRTGERYRSVPGSDDLRRVVTEVADLVRVIRESWSSGNPLERRAGPWCRYCPILDDCDEGKSAEALLG